MFHTEYIQVVDREMLAQVHLSLKQTTESATEIAKMFSERALSSLSMLFRNRFRCPVT